MKRVIILVLLCLPVLSNAQWAEKDRSQHKGDIYIYWGWNRGFYSNSDIHFTGDHYDFTLYDVQSTDDQTEFDIGTHMNPGKLTLPQTNFRIGYFFHEKWNISFGFDHMKYVVTPGQTVDISGEIDIRSYYDGVYDRDEIVLAPSFLQMEHTDGLNYLNFELRRSDEFFRKSFLSVSVTEGIGAGALMPRTDADLLYFGRNDEYHFSGYGFNALVGVQISFWDMFFIQSEFKGGYINMPDILTTNSDADRASQDFFFGQYNLLIGGTFNLGSWGKGKEK